MVSLNLYQESWYLLTQLMISFPFFLFLKRVSANNLGETCAHLLSPLLSLVQPFFYINTSIVVEMGGGMHRLEEK